MSDINKVAAALDANNKLLRELLVSLSGGRSSQKPYKPRTSRSPGGQGGGDIAEEIEAAQKEFASLRKGVRDFNKGLIEGIPLGKIFIKLTERIEDHIEAESKYAEQTIQSAKKLAKSAGLASDKFMKAASDISKMQDLIEQVNKLNIIHLSIQEKTNDITDLQNKASMLKLQLTNKMSADERKALKNEIKQAEKNIKIQEENVKQMQDVIDTNAHLVTELNNLLGASGEVSEAFNNLDDATKQAVQNINIKNGLDAKQLRALDDVNAELDTFSKALQAIAEQTIKSKQELNQAFRDFGSTISNEIVGFIKNEGMGVVDRYVAQRGAGFLQSSYSEALSLGMDEKDITRIASESGLASRAFGGSMERKDAFITTSVEQTARGIMTATQSTIRDVGIAFGVRGAQAAERVMQLVETSMSAGMLTTAPEISKTSDMLMALAEATGTTTDEMAKLWEASAKSGRLTIARMAYEGKTEQEKDKLARQDFAMRVKSLRVMGLQNDQIERALQQSDNALNAGFREKIMAGVASNMAISMFGKNLKLPDGALDLTSDQNSGLRSDVSTVFMHGASLVPEEGGRRDRAIQVAEAVRMSANLARANAAARGDASEVTRVSLMTDIVGGASPNVLNAPSSEDAATAARMDISAQVVEGAADDREQFSARLNIMARETRNATSALVPFADQMVNIANVAAGFSANPAGGAVSSIGSSLVGLAGSGLAGYIGGRLSGGGGRAGGGLWSKALGALNGLGPKGKLFAGLATALTGGALLYSNTSEVDPQTGLPAMSTGEAVARTGVDMAASYGIGTMISKFVVGRLAAAGMGAAGGSIVPGAGTVVGGIAGLVLGPMITDAVFDAFSEDSAAKDTAAMQNPYQHMDPDAALFSPPTTIPTAESNPSKIIDYAKFNLPENWSALPAADKAEYFENAILQNSPDMSPESVEKLKALGMSMSEVFSAGSQNFSVPDTLFGTPYNPNISTDPDDYQPEKEEGIGAVNPEKSPIQKLLERLLDIMEGVEENTKKSSEVQSELFKFNITKESIESQISAFNSGISARTDSLKRAL